MMTDYNKIYILTDKACDVIEDILSHFGVSYSYSHKRISGPCPIHEGNNGGAFNIYPNNNRGPRGLWVCYTRHCERRYGKSLIGFLRGLLSRDGGREASYSDAVAWLCEFLGVPSLEQMEVSPEDVERQKYVYTYSQVMKLTQPSQNGHWDKRKIVQNLQIPARYYVDRGYSESILERYDVGFFPPHQRVIIPVYDDDYHFALGYTKRAVHDGQQPKWLHSDGFDASQALYNFWFAKEEIRKTKTAILVEGPGDVWRLEEGGIHNSVALFKNSISESQIHKLLKAEVLSLVVLLDNDKAGKEGAKQIYQELFPFVRLFFPTINGGDVGELHKDHITKDIKPTLQTIENIYA